MKPANGTFKHWKMYEEIRRTSLRVEEILMKWLKKVQRRKKEKETEGG